MAVQGTDCRAKEAESLEQARRTNDEDLRNLYATIANQWHRLAEEIEKRRSIHEQATAIHKDRDVLTVRVVAADTDPVTHLDHDIVWPGHGDELITFDARSVEGRNDQTGRHEHIGPELQIDAGHPGNSTYQNLEIETTADQDGVVAAPEHAQVADTPGQCSQADQSGNLIGSYAASSNGLEAPITNVDQLIHDRDEPVSRDVEIRNSSISETDTSIAQANAHSEPVQSPNEQLETPTVSHSENIAGPDDQISRVSDSCDLATLDTGCIGNPADQIVETDATSSQINSGLEDIGPPIEISDGDHSALGSSVQHQENPPDLGVNDGQCGPKIDAETRVSESLRGSAIDSELTEQVGPSPRRVETPLEWFFSLWFNTRRR
jgi:hypothetical protein